MEPTFPKGDENGGFRYATPTLRLLQLLIRSVAFESKFALVTDSITSQESTNDYITYFHWHEGQDLFIITALLSFIYSATLGSRQLPIPGQDSNLAHNMFYCITTGSH